jgi:Domain of unknown function (DUF151)
MDARPSDAISLALLTGAPIFVAPEAFKETEIDNPNRPCPRWRKLKTKQTPHSECSRSPSKWRWSGIRSDLSHAIIPSG